MPTSSRGNPQGVVNPTEHHRNDQRERPYVHIECGKSSGSQTFDCIREFRKETIRVQSTITPLGAEATAHRMARAVAHGPVDRYEKAIGEDRAHRASENSHQTHRQE